MQLKTNIIDIPKYNLDGINLKEGDVYTLIRDYDITHILVGEVEYNGQVYDRQKVLKNITAGMPLIAIKSSVVILGYLK